MNWFDFYKAFWGSLLFSSSLFKFIVILYLDWLTTQTRKTSLLYYLTCRCHPLDQGYSAKWNTKDWVGVWTQFFDYTLSADNRHATRTSTLWPKYHSFMYSFNAFCAIVVTTASISVETVVDIVIQDKILQWLTGSYLHRDVEVTRPSSHRSYSTHCWASEAQLLRSSW